MAASAAAAATALLVAIGSERWIGLVPCALCLVERWPYRAALLAALIGLVLPRRLAWWAAGAVLVCVIAAAVAAAVHVGVEQGAWPSPLPQCQAPHFSGGTIAQRLASMPAHPSKSCEDPTLVIPALRLSMAGANLLFALAFLCCLAMFLWRSGRRPA